MAKAKFEKISNVENTKVYTHKDLQKKKVGRPSGSRVKKESSNASLTIALTPTQKKQLENYAVSQYRSVGSLIKMLLIKNEIIEIND